MRTVIAVFLLLVIAGPAFAQEQPKETVKPFTYKKTKQADLAMHVQPDWKKDDKRPAIVFFFGGGWTSGKIEQFEPQASYLAQGPGLGVEVDEACSPRSTPTPRSNSSGPCPATPTARCGTIDPFH